MDDDNKKDLCVPSLFSIFLGKRFNTGLCLYINSMIFIRCYYKISSRTIIFEIWPYGYIWSYGFLFIRLYGCVECPK